MSEVQDFLVEIGTEELPPKALRSLMLAFADGLQSNLLEQRLSFSEVTAYASPRRLAVIVTGLAGAQEAREITRKGPPVSVAFDADGKPTAAATAFAGKCGVSIGEIGRNSSDKGEWLSFVSVERGVPSAELLPACVSAALEALPIPRRMRWGDSAVEFVRPVHWVVMLHGKQVVPGELLGVAAGNRTRGHRFLAPGELRIEQPGSYLETLEKEGFVIADFSARRDKIEADVAIAAAACGGTAVGSDALYEEVAALNEWPVALTGHFDASFLALPREVIIATLTSHQRYFAVAGADDKLLPAFVTIANLESRQPEQVRRGNERVIQPRLADATFFWEADRRHSLADWQASLHKVVYQKGLGSLFDKGARIAELASVVALEVGAEVATVTRAANLAKCDLVSAMVGEFPELQGVMGGYYALADGETDAVSMAIGEQYLPRFSGDRLPGSKESACVSIADKLDSLCGVFALGKKPSGNRDPFGLRRSALGLVRMMVESELSLNLKVAISTSLALQVPSASKDTAAEVYAFIVERMRAYCRDRYNTSAEVFDAVLDRQPESLLDFERRVQAVTAFVELDSAASLAGANKRIGNILRKASYAEGATLDPALLTEDAERTLHDAVCVAREALEPLLLEGRYTEALGRLAELRDIVDRFFDDVMVMAQDEALRTNRLVLLAGLRALFLKVADISRLSISRD
ncbi:MAG: glycine--tRNA ligase subunit beta [Gammaproteobacteria bacterium]|nr:glycine--tRNA ligase subunit beta [Gammaproteobacteria bacterium]